MTASLSLKLPRATETDPRLPLIEAALTRRLEKVWSGSEILASHVPFTASLETALQRALLVKSLERGLEKIEELLSSEEKGLSALRERDGGESAKRVSRLVVMADDGAERFYRHTATMLGRHADRVLALRVDVSAERLSSKLFGEGKNVKLLLVTGKEQVAAVLASLAG